MNMNMNLIKKNNSFSNLNRDNKLFLEEKRRRDKKYYDFIVKSRMLSSHLRRRHELLHILQDHIELPKKTKFTFIHPTKCGGTAVEDFFFKYYRKYFDLIKGHGQTCLNHNNSIIIVRDPIDRFKSIYKYWKYGSERFLCNRKEDIPFFHFNVKDFIQLLKNNDTNKLYRGATWDLHFKSITHWIKNTKLENIIVLKYTKDMNPVIQTFLKEFGIPTVSAVVPHVNITKKVEEKILLDKTDIDFIQNYYKSDFELLDKIQNEPSLFRRVI